MRTQESLPTASDLLLVVASVMVIAQVKSPQKIRRSEYYVLGALARGTMGSRNRQRCCCNIHGRLFCNNLGSKVRYTCGDCGAAVTPVAVAPSSPPTSTAANAAPTAVQSKTSASLASSELLPQESLRPDQSV